MQVLIVLIVLFVILYILRAPRMREFDAIDINGRELSGKLHFSGLWDSMDAEKHVRERLRRKGVVIYKHLTPHALHPERCRASQR